MIKGRESLQNLIVLLLTMNSGCADAISYLGLGQVLTAAMTGNTVFLGLAISGATHMSPLGYLIAILSFMLGAAVGAFVLRHRRSVTGLSVTVTRTLGLELASLAAFAVLAFSLHVVAHAWLIFLLALSMGIQGAAARRIGVNGVPTTVITSTATGLMEYLVWHAFEQREGRRVAATTRVTSKVSIGVWAGDIAIYAVGAALCGVVEQRYGIRAIVLPMLITCVVTLLAGRGTASRQVTLTGSS